MPLLSHKNMAIKLHFRAQQRTRCSLSDDKILFVDFYASGDFEKCDKYTVTCVCVVETQPENARAPKEKKACNIISVLE